MVSMLLAFGAGLLTFLSPCVLPLIPAYLAYLAGTTVAHTSHPGAKRLRLKIFLNTLLFVLGFSIVFSLLGVILTIFVDATYAVQTWLGRIGGALIIVFGLHLTGLLKIPWLEREHTLEVKGLKPSYVTSVIFGATFAVGWTPCIGPVLGSILLVAASHPAQAFALLFAYSLGLGLPFLVVGAFTAQATRLIAKAGPMLRWFSIAVGILLIILGILVFTGHLGKIAAFTFL